VRRFLVAGAFVCVSLGPSFGQDQPPTGAKGAARSRFVFKDNFWLNLHQFLRGEVYRRGTKIAPGLDPASLNENDRALWTAAMEAYVDFAKRDVLFDDVLPKVDNALTLIGDTPRLPASLIVVIGERETSALNSVAAIYRETIWPARQRDNEAWIARAKALMSRYEGRVAAVLAAAYSITWPEEPVLVDAVGEIGPNSAITHDAPPGFSAHTQASTASPRDTADAPLELLFHEACHVPACAGRIQQMIAEECARQKLSVPENLWHSLMIYTSGEIARRELAKNAREYAPYGYLYPSYSIAEKSAFANDWQPYLDGKVAFEQALHDLVRDSR
jgi:hypothetical protein